MLATATVMVPVPGVGLSIGAINYAQCFEATPAITSMTPLQFSRFAGAQLLQRHLAR